VCRRRRRTSIFIFCPMSDSPLCICCIPHVPPDELARHTRPCGHCGRKCRYSWAQHRGTNAPKGTNSIYCSKECEFTRETMRATLQLAHATMRAEQRRAEQQRKMKFRIRCAACGQLFLSKRGAATCSQRCRQRIYRQLHRYGGRPSPNDGPTIRTVG
jgi:hypothetical protein